MPGTPPEIERETIGRTQRGRPRRDWGSDYVSQASGAEDEEPIYRCINPRSVTEMQRKVNKRVKRGAFLRFILTKSDKDEIAAWNKDLVRILHVFNVSSFSSVENRQLSSLLDRAGDRHQHQGCKYPSDGD